MPDTIPVKRALLSVSDKNGLVELGQTLAAHGVEILSTGGSAKALAEAGVPVREVADHTGFPEMMDGRVKTLHPKIHGGILALRDAHAGAMKAHDIGGIDLVVVNLYPFEATVAGGAADDVVIENIDIGGPAMIRSAAKNHAWVTVVVDPGDYGAVIGELNANGGSTSLDLRRRLAGKAYRRTAAYDAAISAWFAEKEGENYPERLTITAELAQGLRYGENPHQSAAFYKLGGGAGKRPGVATARQVQGKELSYNNLNDTDAAFELAAEFGAERPAIAIIKHANPCGVATADSFLEAYGRALACDPVSAFGGIVALNGTLDGDLAAEMIKVFTEVIIAPDADGRALEVLASKPNLRLLLTGAMPDPAISAPAFKSVAVTLVPQAVVLARGVGTP